MEQKFNNKRITYLRGTRCCQLLEQLACALVSHKALRYSENLTRQDAQDYMDWIQQSLIRLPATRTT
jgi:hypothetical protein